MKKLLSMAAIAGLVLFFACGGGGDDPKSVMNEFVDVMEDYANAMENAGSADDVVKAAETAAAKFKALIPKVQAIKEKHPELNVAGGKLPEEYKEIQDRMMKVGAKMAAAATNAMKYMQDPKVMEAMKKFQEAMADMK